MMGWHYYHMNWLTQQWCALWCYGGCALNIRIKLFKQLPLSFKYAKYTPEQAEIPIHFIEECLLNFHFSNNKLHGKEKSKNHTGFFDYSGLTEKNNSKRWHALSRQKGVVGISLYCLKKVTIPQENKSDFKSYTAKVNKRCRKPCYFLQTNRYIIFRHQAWQVLVWSFAWVNLPSNLW